MSEYIEHDKDHISVGLVEKKYFTFANPHNEMILENGSQLGPITLVYETYGTLTPRKNNVILILHALSGDSHVAGYYTEKDSKPGWWDIMVGPGKGIDTNKYFVICSNMLGSCMGSTGPSSTNPETNRPYGIDFPFVTIGDMVSAQKMLLDHLGIQQILSVIGGSIGGMQVLEWCVRYPEMIISAIPLATTTRHSALAIAFNEVARQAIMADPKWNNGDYYSGEKPELGLAIARMVGHITYLSDESMRLKFGRRLQNKKDFSFNFDVDFQVESYLRYQGTKFVERFDANSFLYITKASDYYDLEKQHGNDSAVKAFSKTNVKFLVVSFTSDWLYPTYQSKTMVKAMKKNGLDVSFCEIEAQWGHDAFLLPNDRLTSLMKGFLERVCSQDR
ncbi:MAG: homoserine O-acetyltransferase [Desulfobacterales bacterium]|jgi:homoserine O-acetyltransferase|nr:homoserine O-acetyltransferase [Desulfobacter sp.]MDP6396025.1 homoserine O-acetyltransferase [Desulfobacterales bacterium]MDP6681379.1 homoserine O-acetyltransferase [Desulfobacterales bacterium]MDP6808981.1 homoserine O-acetyltransferase [Desulfobacterales bacterium]|tara:strand:- start:5300 stop:6469 length:1170 start_codon:yes stop_codon:yes gene_type:complete